MKTTHSLTKLTLKKLQQKVSQRLIVVLSVLNNISNVYQNLTMLKYYFQVGVQDGRQIPKNPIICSSIIRNDSFCCIVTCFGSNMVHNVLHTHHSQNISFEIQVGGPKWPPNCEN